MSRDGYKTGAFTTRKPGKQAAIEFDGPPEPIQSEALRLRLKSLRERRQAKERLTAAELYFAGVYTPEHCAELGVKYTGPHCECVCRECRDGDHCGEGTQSGLGDCMHPLKDRTCPLCSWQNCVADGPLCRKRRGIT